MMRGREQEAKALLARLADAYIDSEVVAIELSNIKEALGAQSLMGGFKMRELLTNGPSQNLRRTLLGIAAQSVDLRHHSDCEPLPLARDQVLELVTLC